jgi:hypothetical protein
MISRIPSCFPPLFLAISVIAGCEPAKTSVPIIKVNGAKVASKAMELYDKNKDGKISGPELDQIPSFKSSLDVLGTDADKGVTAEMISARVNKWIEDKSGIMPAACYVMHNGAPVVGAVVKFIPDKFLGDYLTQTGEGTTDSTGLARVTVPRDAGSDMPPGVPPGFYRVEITKSGENIPSQYNTVTVLGEELSLASAIKRSLSARPMRFDLKY